MKLRRIVEDNDTPAGLAFDIAVQITIVLSLVAFSIETLPGLTEQQQLLLSRFELFSVTVFSIEYALRLAVARPPTTYALSFFGIIDLLAIVPFFLGLAVDLRSLRALRLLRLFRLLKMARYNAAIRRFHTALMIAKEEIVLFACMTVIMLYLAAVGIYHFENEAQPEQFASVFHCLWWAVATLTTVGYGDVYPVTAGGRFFTFAILLVGLGVISVPAGLVASALGKARQLEQESKQTAAPSDNP